MLDYPVRKTRHVDDIAVRQGGAENALNEISLRSILEPAECQQNQYFYIYHCAKQAFPL